MDPPPDVSYLADESLNLAPYVGQTFPRVEPGRLLEDGDDFSGSETINSPVHARTYSRRDQLALGRPSNYW